MMWELLLRIKELMKANSDVRWLTIKPAREKFDLVLNSQSHYHESIVIALEDSVPEMQVGAFFRCSTPFSIEVIYSHSLNNEDLKLLSLYLPYALLPHFARIQSRTFSISHFAQTLDGRIASLSCDSKWIGNDENLIHAHRMRALCDAILIGSKTLVIDDPQLNVRHVQGNDPLRVVVGGDNLPLKRYKAITEETLIFSQNHVDKEIPLKTKSLSKVKGKYKADAILKELYEQNICSVYVEGGAYTSSNFLCEKCIDQVQIHFAPKILGSGTIGFNFAGVNKMKDALQFESHRFVAMGDGMMFIGEVK